jgi:hypothetical protein
VVEGLSGVVEELGVAGLLSLEDELVKREAVELVALKHGLQVVVVGTVVLVPVEVDLLGRHMLENIRRGHNSGERRKSGRGQGNDL